MPVSHSRVRLRSVLGWFALTPAELILVAGVIALVALGALPHYSRWEASHRLSDEQHAIMRVRAALHAPKISIQWCPTELDSCPDGSSASECSFFTKVLEDGISGPGWKKVGEFYIGPAGGFYRYDQTECLLRQVDDTVDES